MILGPHRGTRAGGVGARPLGHRPALEHAVRFEPEIVMEPCRVMLLDDEAMPSLTFLAFRDLARGFGGQLEIALLPILGERVGAGTVTRPSWPASVLRTPFSLGASASRWGAVSWPRPTRGA